MEENKFSVNLANMNEVFNNKTLRYRINGFAYACHMHDIGVMGDSGVLFNSKSFSTLKNKKTDEEHSYFIAVNNDFNPQGKSVTLSGHHDDLSFTFINYYDKEKLDKKIYDLPFSISLTKTLNNDTYELHIETDEGIRTEFKIVKYREINDTNIYKNVHFYANILDFSTILKLVKSFVYNPSLVFDTYSDLKEKYKCVYTSRDVKDGILQDTKLDKPMGKIKKLVQRITNND